MYTYSPLGFRSYQCHSRSSSSRGQHIFVSSETSSTRWRKNSREPNRTAQRERLRPLSLQHQPNPRWTQYRWVYLRGGGKKRKGSKVRLMQQTPAGTEKDNFVPWSSLTLVLFSVPPDSPGSFFFFFTCCGESRQWSRLRGTESVLLLLTLSLLPPPNKRWSPAVNTVRDSCRAAVCSHHVIDEVVL